MSRRVPDQPTCKQIVELVTDYLEGRLPLGERTLFEQHLGMPRTDDIPTMTQAARRALRQHFMQADMGISGVNFGVADSGVLHPVNVGDIVHVPISVHHFGGHSELQTKYRVHGQGLYGVSVDRCKRTGIFQAWNKGRPASSGFGAASGEGEIGFVAGAGI